MLSAMSAIAYADTQSTATRQQASLLDSFGVLWRAVVLLGRHWPTLLVISLAGSAAHGLLLWAAVKASRTASALGMLVLVLVPLSLALSLVLMLRIVRTSLPYLSSAGGSGHGDNRALLLVFASVAVPFLAIYTGYDNYLKDDVSTFTYEVWRDSDTGSALSRLPFSPSIGVLCIVVIALVLRYVFGLMSFGVLQFLTLPIGAYTEVVWVCTVTMGATQVTGASWEWMDNRQMGVWWHAVWDTAVPAIQPIREALEAVWHDIDGIFLAPLAWLTLGAVVYGRQLAEGRLTDDRMLTAAARQATRLPKPLAVISTMFGGAIYRRFAPLINGLRLLSRAGLRPMLVFCIALLILRLVPDGLFEIERAVIGPHDLQEFWMPLSYLTAPINVAVRNVLIVCFVAAATDRILQADSEPAAPAVTSEAHSAEALSR
jgi:hypothetical protein